MTYAETDQLADKTGSDIVGWYRDTLVRLATDKLGLKDTEKDAMLGAPAPNDANVRTYCPRCHSQFLLDGGQCPDCPGIGLVRF